MLRVLLDRRADVNALGGAGTVLHAVSQAHDRKLRCHMESTRSETRYLGLKEGLALEGILQLAYRRDKALQAGSGGAAFGMLLQRKLFQVQVVAYMTLHAQCFQVALVCSHCYHRIIVSGVEVRRPAKVWYFSPTLDSSPGCCYLSIQAGSRCASSTTMSPLRCDHYGRHSNTSLPVNTHVKSCSVAARSALHGKLMNKS